MATIKQLIDELRSGALPDRHKNYIISEVEKATQLIDGRKVKKPRRITTASPLMTLEEWEARNGTLGIQHLAAWVTNRKLHGYTTGLMVEEFRIEMMSKGKQYANFSLAFQTYLMKGYLSKPFAACLIENLPKRLGDTTVNRRGGNL